MMVTNAILFGSNVSESFLWSLSITLSFPLMYFVYHIFRCSRTEHPNKRAVTELRFHYRIKDYSFLTGLDKASVLCEAFLHKFLMWLLIVSLLSIVNRSIFCSLLLFITKPLKIKFYLFSKTQEITLPSIKSHVIFIKPFYNCIKISSQVIFYLF